MDTPGFCRRKRTMRTARLIWSVLLLVTLIGCAGPAIRSQSPSLEGLASIEAATQLVGDFTAPWGLNVQQIERAALVTGLADTGSDPPPGGQRQMLLSDMQTRGVVEPNRLLASRSTALVWVRGQLHPGIRKGDRFDVMVEVPADHDTTSLDGGWLMETRLAEMALLGNRVRDGHVLGLAEGPLLVDPVSNGTLDSVSKLRAIIPGGGTALFSRSIGLSLVPEHRSVSLSKRIGDCINRRFHAIVHGVKRGVATPKTDRFIELEIPAIYRRNLGRYLAVIRSVALSEPAGNRHARLELLSRQLADPVTAPAAALRLEAIGKEAITTLREALESTDAEVRFAAAEALAYLGESMAATHLAEAAGSLRTARPKALAALSVLDDANGIDALQTLLPSRSAETRYGAFRALREIDSDLPLIRGESLGDACGLHTLDVQGPPLIHATRTARAEIVLFGASHPVDNGLRAEAGPSTVIVVDRGRAAISRFLPGEPDETRETPAEVGAILRTLAELGGTYPDLLQFLQQASSQRAIDSRLAFDAIPSELDGRLSLHQEASSRDREIPESDLAPPQDAAEEPDGFDVKTDRDS